MNNTLQTRSDTYSDIDKDLGFQQINLESPVEEWVENVSVTEKHDEPIDIESLRYAATMLYMMVSRGALHHIPDEKEATRHVLDTINVFNNMRERLMNTKGKELLVQANIIKQNDTNIFSPALELDEINDEHLRELKTDNLIESIRKNLETLVSIDVIHGDMFREHAEHEDIMHPRGSVYDPEQAKFIRIDGEDLQRAINAESTHKKFKHRFIVAGGPEPDKDRILQILLALNKKYPNNDFCIMNTAITNTDELVLNACMELNLNINTVNVSDEHNERVEYLAKTKQNQKAKCLTSIVSQGSETRKHEADLLRNIQRNMKYKFKDYQHVFNSPGPLNSEKNNPYRITDSEYYQETKEPANEKTAVNYIRNTDIMLTNFNITGCVLTDNSFQANMIRTRAMQHNIPVWDLSTPVEKDPKTSSETNYELEY